MNKDLNWKSSTEKEKVIMLLSIHWMEVQSLSTTSPLEASSPSGQEPKRSLLDKESVPKLMQSFRSSVQEQLHYSTMLQLIKFNN